MNRLFLTPLIIALFTLTFARSAAADPTFRPASIEEELVPLLFWGAIGMDDAIGSSAIGIQRWISPTLALDGSFSTPLVMPDLGDGEFSFGLTTLPLSLNGSFNLPIRAAIFNTWNTNDIFFADAIGSRITLSPGYFRSRWAFGGELTWKQAWISYFKPNDRLQNLWPDSEPVFALAQATTFRAGIWANVSVSNVTQLSFSGGYQKDGVYNIMAPPFFARLAFSTAF